MNVYVCSTVRHVLFAVLRASKISAEEHHILYFADFQNASLDSWDTDGLGPQVHIHALRRESFRQQLNASLRGKLLYFLAMRNLAAPAALQAALRAILDRDCPEFSQALQASTTPALWLFNERNKMARLLRMLISRFNLLEEGEANYHFVACPWWKWPARLLLGRPPRNRCYGEDPRCQALHVIAPNKLPAAVRHKAHPLDFLQHDTSREVMQTLFGREHALTSTAATTLLATQPLEIFDFVTPAEKQHIYLRIATLLRQQGRDVQLKLHPAEELADYKELAQDYPLLPGKLPIEALIVLAAEPVEIVSLWSTAGLGFESNCHRRTLIPADHQPTLRRWLQDPELMMTSLQAALSRPDNSD